MLCEAVGLVAAGASGQHVITVPAQKLGQTELRVRFRNSPGLVVGHLVEQLREHALDPLVGHVLLFQVIAE
jgi:hypothetical protein